MSGIPVWPWDGSGVIGGTRNDAEREHQTPPEAERDVAQLPLSLRFKEVVLAGKLQTRRRTRCW
jgi:hypothetical protein